MADDGDDGGGGYSGRAGGSRGGSGSGWSRGGGRGRSGSFYRSRSRPYRGRGSWGRGNGSGAGGGGGGFISNRQFQPDMSLMMPPPSPMGGNDGGSSSGFRRDQGQRASSSRGFGFGSGPGPYRSRTNTNTNLNDSEGDRDSQSSYQRRPILQQPTIESYVLKKYEETYPGYQLYFGRRGPALPEAMDKIKVARLYLNKSDLISTTDKLLKIQASESFELLFENIIQDEIIQNQWPTFQNDLQNFPQEVINIWGLAMHTLVFAAMNELENRDDTDGEVVIELQEIEKKNPRLTAIQARIMKNDPLTPLKLLKSALLGKFITIRGAVVRTGIIRPQLKCMAFRCTDCMSIFQIEQPGGIYALPNSCTTEDCRSKTFDPLHNDKLTKLLDSRKISVQDVQHGEYERGAVPRSIDCMLTGDLVKHINAGDAVTLSGIVAMSKETPVFGADQSLHSFYIQVVALRNHKDSERTMGGNWFSFSDKDYFAVQTIHEQTNLFRLLVASICPTIYGHNLVKAGLLLCLFGGTPSESDMLFRRSDINVLIVGDPGLGKSQMLSLISEIAPRGVYVCGTSSTAAGLTVTLVKDGDDYSLEAGALIMADRGVCCIDEFDKMQPHHQALLEAMEQQSISIAKSGVYRTLPARTSVIAAANPIGGHYNPAKSVGENIRISPALLSRFDLIFILVDKTDEETDRNIVNHIMGLRPIEGPLEYIPASCGSIRTSQAVADEILSLAERLKFEPDEEVDLIPHHLTRKYIAYAKQYVKPKLTAGACEILKKYYLNLRNKHRSVDATPVTPRQLESLLRLTQARAKIELRELATDQDAKDVLEIFDFGMSGVFENDIVVATALSELASLPPTPQKIRAGTKGQAKKLVSALQRMAEQQCKNKFSTEEIRQVGRALGMGAKVDDIISALNNEGLLLNKGGKVYQLQTADF